MLKLNLYNGMEIIWMRLRMDNLPKRNDDIYKEIENFEDYELTECIAYEMAIRTDIIKNYLEFKKKKINNKADNLKLIELEDRVLKECWIHHHSIHLNHYEKYNYILDAPSNFEKTEFVDITKCKEDDIGSKQIINVAFSENTPSRRKVHMTTSRPLLQIPTNYKNDMEVNINFNKPEKEIIEYIKILKNFNDNNIKISRTSNQLLENISSQYAKTNKIKKQKLYANMFFVYDYIKAREQQIDNLNLNDEAKNESNEEILHIKCSHYLNSNDRKIQIKEIEKKLKKNLIKYPSSNPQDDNCYFNEYEFLQSNIKPGTAKDYYYAIKPFIDKLEFKQLLTGIINI